MSQQVIQSPGVAPPGKLTYEEFLEWLDDETHAEWVDGEVVFMSPVVDRHSDLAGFLLALLRVYVRRRHLGVMRAEPFQMKIGPGLPGRSPDLFFIASENRHRLKRTFLDGPADLAVEILSQESVHRDRVEKFPEYERGGVREYWLIDPERRQADFHVLRDGAYQAVPIDDQGVFHSVVLSGLWLRLEWLWQDPLPDELEVLAEWGVL